MSLSILIADDSAIVRAVVRKVLALTGLDVERVHDAGDGLEALQILRRNRLDLVLADVNMPNMGGVELLAEMHADPALAGIPVVIVSSERTEPRIDELRRTGARAYVTKPFRPEQLGKVLRDVLRGVNHAG
jgi:two-component system chemotaxis response regulator CheY